MAAPEELVHRTRPADGEPEGALVLLHGRATGEDDIFPLADELDPDRRLVAVAPRGPLSLPPGGAHWYRALRVGYPEAETFLGSYAKLGAWIDSLPDEIGVPIERTVIAGLSQGAVMTYAVGLGEERPRPAAIVAFAGFMPVVDGFALGLDGLSGFPAAVAHGTFDPVIEVGFGQQARDRLEEAGADVLWRESPVEHVIDPDVFADIAAFVGRAV